MTAAVLSRRRLLQLGVAGLSVAVLPTLSGCALPVIPKRPAPSLGDAMGWVRHAGGRTTLIVPRVEMGQNILTALKQIVCMEMGVAWDTVDAELHGTHSIGRVRATVGSDSVKDYAVPLAQACATLRDALARGQTEGRLTVVERPLDQLRFLQARAPLAGPGPVPVEQGEAIVRGQALYAADVRRPGLLHGRVLRAPVSTELRSRPLRMNEAAARSVPSFVALVQDDLLIQVNSGGVGVVARTPGALDRIAQALAIEWQVEGSFDQASIDRAIDIDRRLAGRSDRTHTVHDDKLDTDGPRDLDLRLDVPLAAHATLEPRAAVAEFDMQGGLQVWVGSQDVFYQRDVLVKRLGLSQEKVRVHGQRVGGAFGGKTICTVELEAAVLARAAQAPVKVQWSRAQEFQQGFHRPPSSHRIRARLRDGKLQDWWHGFASSHILLTSAAAPPWLQSVALLIGDNGVARGAALPYRAAARRTGFDLQRLPVHTGPWRGLGAGPNGFAIESAIDECARIAGADPVQFRLDHILDPRLAGVLRRVADAADWSRQRPTPATAGLRTGRGVACGIYKEHSYAAVAATVQVDTATGAVQVLQLWCAHDCGHVVNPDQVRAQCEGNLVWGIGMALLERLPVGGSRVAADNFADVPIPRLSDVPPLQVLLVDSREPPSGAGETGIVAAAAAIANAVRDALGVRPLKLPLRPEAVRTMIARNATEDPAVASAA